MFDWWESKCRTETFVMTGFGLWWKTIRLMLLRLETPNDGFRISS
jgi:hypothetical protein